MKSDHKPGSCCALLLDVKRQPLAQCSLVCSFGEYYSMY